MMDDYYEDDWDFDENDYEEEERYQDFLEAYDCRCGAIQYGPNGAYRVADCVC